VIRTNQLELLPKVKYLPWLNLILPLLSLLLEKTELKSSFLELRVVLYNFSRGTILFDDIKTNQLELQPKVKLSASY